MNVKLFLCVCVHAKNILNMRIHKIMDYPLHLVDINLCAIIQNHHTVVATLVMLVQDPAMKHSCSATLRYPAISGVQVPCLLVHVLLIANVINFLVTIRSALRSGRYLADPRIKITHTLLCSPEHLATIDFEVRLKSIFVAVSQLEQSLRKYVFP